MRLVTPRELSSRSPTGRRTVGSQGFYRLDCFAVARALQNLTPTSRPLDALCVGSHGGPNPTYAASVACQLFWACNMCWPCRAVVLAFVTPLLPRLRCLPVSVSVLRGAPVKIVYHLILLSEEIQVRSHVCYLCRRDPCCSMHALSGTLAVHRSVDMRGLHSWACTSRCGGAYTKKTQKKRRNVGEKR